ncbi:MAG TPA: pyridoxal-phosphate dependent enzyme, partial [Actinomycetes bacterium]|nr:pyridoxal-phosphate dependent enzyme [Actinomycetes bacterium]
MTGLPVDLTDVLAARELIADVVRHTPLTGLRPLTERCGGPVWLKCENLQRAGSFKIRGAYTRLARLSDDEQNLGVVAASAGNHAQGVALAAQMLGVKVTVFMPEGATLAKVSATRGYGADVRFHGQTLGDSIDAARAFCDESGRPFIHPYDHRDIVAGQGTVGLEILEQCPEVRTIVVCTGGGGLLAGIATAVKGLRPDVKVV